MTTEMTVFEAINYAIENGIEQAQKQLEYWKKYQRLAKNNAKSLERSLLQLHETVEFNGYGKRGKVILGVKLDVIKEREDNRGRKVTAAQIEFMQNAMGIIIDNDLINKPYTLTTWADKFGVPLYSTSQYSKELQKLVRELENTFELKHTDDVITQEEFTNPYPRFQWFRTIDIAKDFVARYNGRAKNITQSAFKIAQEKGIIETMAVYSAVKDENYKEISEQDYKKFKAFEKKIITEYDYSILEYYERANEWTRYIKDKPKLITDQWKVFEKEYNEINDKLISRFDIERAFESIKIVKVSDEIMNYQGLGDVSTGGFILKQNMKQDMYKRYFESASATAKNLYLQSDFKKRFAYLIATVLLDDIDTKHMDSFHDDLKGFVREFEKWNYNSRAFVTASDVNIYVQEKVEEMEQKLNEYEQRKQALKDEINQYHNRVTLNFSDDVIDVLDEDTQKEIIEAQNSYDATNCIELAFEIEKQIEKKDKLKEFENKKSFTTDELNDYLDALSEKPKEKQKKELIDFSFLDDGSSAPATDYGIVPYLAKVKKEKQQALEWNAQWNSI